MTAQLEYAVRTTSGGDTTIVPVGDEVLMRQTVAEFLERGDQAEPLTRTVTDWHVDEAALARARRDVNRENVLHIAQLVFEEESTRIQGIAALAAIIPGSSPVALNEDLRELVAALGHAENVEERRLELGAGETWEALAEAADEAVEAAVNALLGAPCPSGAARKASRLEVLGGAR